MTNWQKFHEIIIQSKEHYMKSYLCGSYLNHPKSEFYFGHHVFQLVRTKEWNDFTLGVMDRSLEGHYQGHRGDDNDFMCIIWYHLKK